MAGRRARLATALAAALAVALAALLHLFDPVSLRAYDLASTLAPKAPAAPGVVIVAIDEPSFSALGRPWPWPRDVHGRLLTSLRRAGVKAVGVDVVFAEPTDPAADAALAAAAGPDTVFAADESVIEAPYGQTVVRTEPLPALLADGAQVGVASLALDGDGVLRRIPRYPDGFAARLVAKAGGAPAGNQAGRLVQYLGPPGAYPRVSFYQALEPERYLPPGLLKDRVVIVGYALQTSPEAGVGGTDAFETPWTQATRTLSAGAEVQATLFDNLRSGLGVREAPAIAAWIALGLGVLAGWFASTPQSALRRVLLVAGGIVLSVAGAWIALRFGRVWLSPVAPATAVAALAVALGGHDFAVEQRRLREIQGAFSQYVSPAVVERLIADPSRLQLGGETRDLTILFCDIRGFTSVAEAMRGDPQGLTRVINGILTPLSDIVLAHGGTIDKYMGDCVMAFWGAPLDDADHALHAVEAGRAMLAALPQINAALQALVEGGVPPIRVGVGINSGEVVIGNMGSARRFDYTVLGDAVNIAARLEGLTKTYGVDLILGEATAKQLPESVVLREVDRVAVRGRSEAQALYTLA